MNWGEFFNMGGYAWYIWGSYIIATLVLGLNAWLPLRRFRQQQHRFNKRNETPS